MIPLYLTPVKRVAVALGLSSWIFFGAWWLLEPGEPEPAKDTYCLAYFVADGVETNLLDRIFVRAQSDEKFKTLSTSINVRLRELADIEQHGAVKLAPVPAANLPVYR